MKSTADARSASTSPRAGWTAGLMVRDRDLDAIVALLGAVFVNPWTQEMLEQDIDHADVSRIYVLRSADGGLVAFCSTWVVAGELHINNLGVRHEDRRRGAATFLLCHLLDDVRTLGVDRATLEVRESNVAARRLYGRLGFVVAGRRAGYYRAPVEDALILWCCDIEAGSSRRRVTDS